MNKCRTQDFTIFFTTTMVLLTKVVRMVMMVMFAPVPLLIAEYAEIIVVDIRYVAPSVLPKLVRFKGNCDVLFLYSTSVLNSYGVFR